MSKTDNVEPHPVRLVREDERWLITSQGWRVTQIVIDHAFTLSFWQNAHADVQFRIQGRFRLHSRGETYELDAGAPPATALAPALDLFDQELQQATAYDDGRLELRFGAGATVFVLADPDYEAWEAVGNGGMKLVSLPGGGLAVWQADQGRAE